MVSFKTKLTESSHAGFETS